MRADNPAKHFAIALVLAVVIYAVAYSWIENRRHRKGPWEVTFTNSPAQFPMLVLNQPKLGITNVQIVFPGQAGLTNFPPPMEFRIPRECPIDMPFGSCIFMDLTFLPGTLTFRLFGHEVEFLPRTMILDHEEHPWRSGEIISLAPAAAQPKTNHF